MRDLKRRRKGTRRPRNIVVIVCEGLETERIYFEGFNERFSSVNVKPIHSGSTDPRSIVDYAIQQKSEYDIEEGDEFWCVFDVDENTDQDIKDSISHGNANGIKTALSNPSFELWYLLHFIFREASIDRREVNNLLESRYLPGYSKSKCYNEVLKNHIQNAITYAERLNRIHEEAENPLISRSSNPSTQVFILVRSIDELKRRNIT